MTHEKALPAAMARRAFVVQISREPSGQFISFVMTSQGIERGGACSLNLADRFDGGRRTMKIDCNVTPTLTREEVDTCLSKGFALSQNLMLQLANHSAYEDILRDAKAELYTEEQHPM